MPFTNNIPQKDGGTHLLGFRSELTRVINKYTSDRNSKKNKITLSGDHEEFKAFKKSKKYKNLISENIKIVFKPKKDKSSELINKDNKNLESIDFKDILNSIVLKQKDPYLFQVY